MSHKKRLSRREARKRGMSNQHNYHSIKAFKQGKKREELGRAGRLAARKR